MIKRILAIISLFTALYPVHSQNNREFQPELRLKSKPSLLDGLSQGSLAGNFIHPKSSPYYKKSGIPAGTFAAGITLMFINPILVFEDKKIFWGLTKELSKSIYPYGRLSFEYSFLFRTFNKNHFRFAYNYDLIYQQGSSWLMFVISLGAGYFTDTENKGAFAQTSMGFFIPTPFFLIHPYLKYRFTKISKENKSDIHDISLGAGFVF